MASLKTEVDKLDIDKLTHFPVDLSKLSHVVKNDVVKKTEYYKLVAKVNNIDTAGFVLKTTYDTNQSDFEKEISNTSNVAKKPDLNVKITGIENEIPSITGLATSSALNVVENEIPDVRKLVN